MSGYQVVEAVSHAARVRVLYKEACRHLQSYYYHRHLYRYHACVLRARFDESKNELNPSAAKQLLEGGEHELWVKQHPQPFKFPNSPGGVGFGRTPRRPDSMLDMWHPLEKAAYPEYFSKREQRKQEFMDSYEKKYGKPDMSEH